MSNAPSSKTAAAGRPGFRFFSRPLLTRKEQGLLAFLLALLILGGIVRKVRTEWQKSPPVSVRKS